MRRWNCLKTGPTSCRSGTAVAAAADRALQFVLKCSVKQGILRCRSEVVRIFADNERDVIYPLQAGASVRQTCTGSSVLAATGLRFCYATDTHLPFDVSVDVTAEDLPSGVEIEVGTKTVRDRSHNNLLLLDVILASLDTPDSRTDRKHLLQFGLDRARRFFEAKLLTPWKTYTGSGQYNNDADDKRVEVALTEDGVEAVAAVVSYERSSLLNHVRV